MSIVLSKSFSPTTIADGGITTLTFTIVVNEEFPQPVLQIFDTLPSGLAYGGSFSVPDGWIVFLVPPTGSNGTIQVDGISLPNGTYTLTFAITNVSGQTNPSCELNPSAFTNQSSNLILNPPIFTFDGVPSCLVVGSTPPPPPVTKKRRKIKRGVCPNEFVLNFRGQAPKYYTCGGQTYKLTDVRKYIDGELGKYTKLN